MISKDKLLSSYLAENLVIFTNILRKEGLPISSSETMDALQALQSIDLSSRDNFKVTLQATLIKNYRDRVIFNSIFDYFFAPPEVHSRGEERTAAYKQQHADIIKQAGNELTFKGEPLQLTAKELAQYSTMSVQQRERLQMFMYKTEAGVNVKEPFRPILETVVKSHLRYCRTTNTQDQSDVNHTGQKNFRSVAGGGGSAGNSGQDSLSELDMQFINTKEMPRVEQIIQRLSKKLAVQILRRRKHGPKSRVIDLRSSLRDNLRYGGTIFKIKYKPKHRTREQILLLCDVSASMKKYSAFALQFLYGLREAVRDLSCFCFSDQLENITPEIKKRRSINQVLEHIIQRSETWGGGTNLGMSLYHLRAKYPDLINRRTTIIVVSDTRTIALDYAIDELRRLNDQAGRIIWLNPLPREQWSEHRSVREVSVLTDMWPCNTIAQLDEVLQGRF